MGSTYLAGGREPGGRPRGRARVLVEDLRRNVPRAEVAFEVTSACSLTSGARGHDAAGVVADRRAEFAAGDIGHFVVIL